MALSTVQRRGNVEVGEDQCSEDIRIVLIGRTGSGKSKSANTILGFKRFEELTAGESVTQNCDYETVKILGLKVMVIDTPGFFDTKRSNKEICKEVAQCIGLSSPGPHVFLFVLAIGRMTAEVRESINLMKTIFGPGVLNYTIVLFTRLDDLIDNDKEEEEATVKNELFKYIKSGNDDLQNLIKDCKERYVAFDNRASKQKKEKYTESLLKLAKDLKHENKDVCYTNFLYELAENALQDNIAKKRQEFQESNEQKIKELEDKIKKETEEKLKSSLERKKKQLEENRHSEVTVEHLREDVKRDLSNDSSPYFKTFLAVLEKVILPIIQFCFLTILKSIL